VIVVFNVFSIDNELESLLANDESVVARILRDICVVHESTFFTPDATAATILSSDTELFALVGVVSGEVGVSIAEFPPLRDLNLEFGEVVRRSPADVVVLSSNEGYCVSISRVQLWFPLDITPVGEVSKVGISLTVKIADLGSLESFDSQFLEPE
jgi:hypothetical protein